MFPVEQLLLGNLQQQSLEQRWDTVLGHVAVNEMAYINQLSQVLDLHGIDRRQAQSLAIRWIQQLREEQQRQSLEPILQEFRLSTPEGLALMTLAEALLRIPDSHTADALIRDRLQSAEWNSSKEPSPSLWINLSSWALGQAKHWFGENSSNTQNIQQLVRKLGEPVLRSALHQAISMVANQYIIGETIHNALDQSHDTLLAGNTFSFDMLGEAALSLQDAQRYEQAYSAAIHAIGSNESYPENTIRPSISIKLSALHPRFEACKGEHMLTELEAVVTRLVEQARQYDIAVTIDAEECDRLEPTLMLVERLIAGAAHDWGAFGLAVQAYQKRALPVLHWLEGLAETWKTPIPVRLVKGAYWDTEIKLSQQRGESDYPVFTSKASTDTSYLCCAQYLLSEFNNFLRPQFASHNALTLSQLACLGPNQPLECQRLHGMGQLLHQQLQNEHPFYTRIYAPVGDHQHLLPYLIRRLLENGANSSFVNQLTDTTLPAEQLAIDPRDTWEENPIPGLPPPVDLFLPRLNSKGVNLQLGLTRQHLKQAVAEYQQHYYFAAPMIDGDPIVRESLDHPMIFSPSDQQQSVGETYNALAEDIASAYSCLLCGQPKWANNPVQARAGILERYADLLQQHTAELLQLCVRETGKTLEDGIAEIREAVDLCRYYAAQGRELQGKPEVLTSITGEDNQLSYLPRGIFLCISPWNFPIAIFSGQIAAALITGNGVIAKPSQQSTMIAYRCIQLLLEAGVPGDTLAFTPGKGSELSDKLLSHPQLSGVAFTGSTDTARTIARTLAHRPNTPLASFIAETGGQNALIADSSTLIEQLVKDVITSAFTSAGQRCSALRVLYLQEEIYDQTLQQLKGAMAELQLGDPADPATDIGPIISAGARKQLLEHIEDYKNNDRVLYQTPLPDNLPDGYYLAPALIQLDSIQQLEQEHFGPILHVIRYRAKQLDKLIDEIHQTRYGLTFGIHSRNESFIRSISRRIRAGNIYINRNQIGATVGCQPFGGMGLSGTGPKAGGPNYLRAFVYEQTETTNTTAWGGNVNLLGNTNHKS